MSTQSNNHSYNESLSKHTSWKVGGPADIFFCPENRSSLSEFLKSNHGNQITWLGNGTNLLVRDSCKLSDKLSSISFVLFCQNSYSFIHFV